MKISNRFLTLINCLMSNVVFCIVVLKGGETDPKTAIGAALFLAVFHPIILRINKVSSFEFDADERTIKLEAEHGNKP